MGSLTTARVRPGGSAITWSFPGENFGANIVAQGNPALISAGNVASRIRVRAELNAHPNCFVITSYSIHYTKLYEGLATKRTADRLDPGKISPQTRNLIDVGSHRYVITSYSIHYTKLYEAVIPAFFPVLSRTST